MCEKGDREAGLEPLGAIPIPVRTAERMVNNSWCLGPFVLLLNFDEVSKGGILVPTIVLQLIHLECFIRTLRRPKGHSDLPTHAGNFHKTIDTRAIKTFL